MHLTEPENKNYAATVVKINETHELQGCDNVCGTVLFGLQAVVGKDTAPGTMGVVFPAETQLSDEYTKTNNLYRHSDLNGDESKKGYLEDNRRVRAVKFRGHRSDCLWLPIESLSYIKGWEDLKEGDTFDKLGEHEICKKYVVKKTYAERRVEKNKDKFVRVDTKFLPNHYDTDNYFRNVDVIPDNALVYITQKLHGTSIRIANTYVARKLSPVEKLLKRLGVKVSETEFDYVFGSRKVIKDVNNPNQNHFYGSDIYTEEGKKLEGTIPEGYILYGELVGWTAEGSPLQKNYTYQIPEKTCELYIYRVAFVNHQGVICDLSWDQTIEFCRDRGIKTVPELWRTSMAEFKKHIDDFMDKRYRDGGYLQALPLGPEESLVDEGVCIRVDGIAPYILKAKSPIFLQHETKMNDEQVVDIEEEQKDV